MNKNLSIKNYQDENVIRCMYENVFHTSAINLKISKMSGGFKNAVYLLEKSDQKIVLKIDAQDFSKLITVDQNIMWWEVEVLRLMNKLHIKSPELLYFDDSCEICSAPYFFMSYIPGINYLDAKKYMNIKDIESIEYQIGELTSIICSIKKHDYFLPSNPELKFHNNFDFVMYLFEQLLSDSLRCEALNSITIKTIYNILIKFKSSLLNVTGPCLTCTDMWDGNIIVSGNRVMGLVDFADVYYCDEFMSFYYHLIDGKTSFPFLKGAQKKELSQEEKNRIDIYRMYVILKMIVDGNLRGYSNLDWMYNNLNDNLLKLSK